MSTFEERILLVHSGSEAEGLQRAASSRENATIVHHETWPGLLDRLTINAFTGIVIDVEDSLWTMGEVVAFLNAARDQAPLAPLWAVGKVNGPADRAELSGSTEPSVTFSSRSMLHGENAGFLLDQLRPLFVREVQAAFSTIDLYDGEIDGQENPAYIAAISAFQGQRNLPPTGFLGPVTIHELTDVIRASRTSSAPPSVRAARKRGASSRPPSSAAEDLDGDLSESSASVAIASDDAVADASGEPESLPRSRERGIWIGDDWPMPASPEPTPTAAQVMSYARALLDYAWRRKQTLPPAVALLEGFAALHALRRPEYANTADLVVEVLSRGGKQDDDLLRLGTLGLALLPDTAFTESRRASIPGSQLLYDIGARAMEIAHDVVPRGDTQTRYTAMRHLLAATVTYEPAQRGLAEHLGQLGISVQAFRSRLLSVLRQAGSGENVAVWLELLAAAPAAIGLHKEAPAAFMDRDAPTGHDKLSITAEVNALAAVLASRQLKPPLSVGLFGDWGTGKSFFMRRMFLRIRKHASDAEQKVPGSEAFHSRIVQITFNAWHYMDANLWASLVTGVFDGLAEHLKGKEQSVAHMREQLLSRLAADHSVLRDAERRKVAAEDATRRARDQMEQVRAQSAGLRSVLRASPDVLRAAVDHPAVTGKLAQLAESYGIPSSVVVERAWADRLNTRMDRVRALLQVMSGKGGDRRRLLITGLFTLAILAAAYVAWRAAGWAQDSGAVRSLAAAGAAVSALGIQWAGYLRPLSMKIRKAAAEARQIRGKAGELAAQVMEDEEKPRSEARRRLQHLEAEEQAAVEAHDAAVRQVHKAQEELEEIQAGRRLHRFIAERSATADYRRHLGIVALIRNDFERLSTLLQEAGTSADGEVPAVERIILYIDDLDRCPEQRVVEVLQAVHLLLAFPLFVVVVGVDSRWLLRSVRSHYSELLSGGDEPRGGRGAQGEEDENDWASTPQNYLEKIFQIPFTLRPMNSDGYASLIQGLIPMEGDPEEEAGDDGEGLDLYRPTSPVIPRVAVAASPEAITSISPVAQESTATRREAQESPVITEEGSTAGPVRTAVGPPRELVSVGTRTRIVGPDKQAGDAEGGQRAAMATGESPLGDSTADAAEGLQITSDEREFLQRLSPLIPSPRSAKRLVNVYRFIRGSLSPDERDRFLGAGGTVPEYPAVALLLGVVTGFPTQAVTLFQALIENDAAGTSTWWDFCNGLEAPPEDPRCWAKFRAALAELERARTPLLADTALDPFVRWAPYVSRFSFQTGNLFARRHG